VLKDSLQKIQNNIQAALERASRSEGDVAFLAVSKTFSPERIQEVYDLGQRLFGESRPQELEGKISELPNDIQWHLIGHLQTNKVKKVVGAVKLIHSLDSLRLAEVISRESQKKEVETSCLLEINMTREESKFGYNPDTLEGMLDQIQGLPNLKICGLMTIGPDFRDSEDPQKIDECRKVFQGLRQLREKLENRFESGSFQILSMGMSHDYELAIEEGSTLVRIGSALFGERNL